MPFIPGSVVTLNSGGQHMTVVESEENEVVCMWMSEAGTLFREAIPVAALKLAGSDEAEDDDDDDDDEDDDEDDEDDD
jgi:uncharacterized protein YodC (DUF2158 family)